MRLKSEVNLSKTVTPVPAGGYTEAEAVEEAMRCLDCPAKYCQRDCPIHVPVPEMCAAIRAKDYEGAWALVAAVNELSPVSSRVCPGEKQCRSNCTRGIRGESVNICALEQFINDRHEAQLASAAPASGKRVGVIGSGPAGLCCALELAKAGVRATVYEKDCAAGGVMRWGIPDFVLPRVPLDALIKRAEALGVRFACGKAVSAAEALGENDAVFLAVGAEKPVSSLDGAVQAKDFLTSVSQGQNPAAGKTVAVIGGGDTALDAARAAVRLGAASVRLVYRRGEAEMPARDADVNAAKSEGVEFLFWTDTVSYESGVLTCQKTEPDAPDYPGGRLNCRPVAESIFSLDAALVIEALGFANIPPQGVSCDAKGRVLADEDGRTADAKLYAGGDAVTGPSTVIRAAAFGKRAACSILKDLI